MSLAFLFQKVFAKNIFVKNAILAFLDFFTLAIQGAGAKAPCAGTDMGVNTN